MTEGQEREQEKTIEWYKAQAKETTDLKRITFHLWKNDDDESGDEYFPNKVERKYRQLQTENISHARRIKELESDYTDLKEIQTTDYNHAVRNAERIKELEDEAERLRWISVNEKLPEEDTYFVLYDDGEQRFIYEADFVDKKWYSMTGHSISFVTHYKLIILPEQALKVGLTKGKVKKVGPRTPRPNVKPVGQKPAKHVLKRPVVYNDRVVGPS